MSQVDASHPGVSRRRFLLGSGIGLVAAGGLGLEGLVWEPERLSVTSHRLGSDQGMGRPIRLAVLTDLHLRSISRVHHRIAAALGRSAADVVVLAGDSIDDAANLALLSDFLRLLPPTGRRVATLGNWEHWSGVDLDVLRQVYLAGNTTLLVNEGLTLGNGAFLFGTDDFLAGRPTLDAMAAGPGEETIVISHSPAYRDTLDPADSRIRAMIAGHTHGGQVAIGRWAPWCPPGSGRYVSGWYRDGGVDLFVSRGIGTSIVSVRLGSSPELALIDWYPHSGTGCSGRTG